MAKQLNVNLAFTADTGRAKAQLQDLQKQLSNLVQGVDTNGIASGITNATKAAAELKIHLEKATNVKTGNLDFTKLNESIKQSGKTLTEYGEHLNSLGPQGQKAFMALTESVSNAEVPIRRTNAALSEMWTVIKNTARWQISSSILHGFIGSVQSAYNYAQNLNESLNQIRIVTGQNTDQMANFAEQANKAAKALSTTTTSYTNASLIYYQQGLSDEEVQERTNITIKMANAANQSAEIISDQLTAVWNNFYDGSQSLEHYADAMTRLGADTASSTDEIAEGLEKFASVADLIGLSFDNAAAALATVTATTRQSADVVGTAFKTIFARIQGLNLGETLDDGTDLNKYSKALNTVGINIKDQNGQLKDMDTILDEMGSKWNSLSKDQQTALAQTVAGVRQYTQLVSLMDNWDFYQKNLESAKNSDGSLQEQADIYAESWEAAQKRVRAALEGIYSTLVDDDAFITALNLIEKVITYFDNLIDTVGGLGGVLTTLGTILTRVFSSQISQSISNMAYSLKMVTPKGQKEAQQEKSNFIGKSAEIMAGMEGSVDSQANKTASEVYTKRLTLQQQMIENVDKMNDMERQTVQLMMDKLNIQGKQTIEAAKQVDTAQNRRSDIVTQIYADSLRKNGSTSGISQAVKSMDDVKKSAEALNKVQTIFNGIDREAENLSDQLEEVKLAFSQLKAQKSDLVLDDDEQALNKIIQNLNQARDNQENWNVAVQQAQGLFQKINDSTTTTAAEITGSDIETMRQYGQVVIEVENAENQLQQQNENLASSNDKVSESINNAQGKQKTWADNLVSFANGALSVVSALQMIGGIVDTLENPDMSGWEKVLSIGSSILMMVGMLVPTFTSLAGAISSAGVSATAATGPVIGLGTAFNAALGPIGWVSIALAALVAIIAVIITSLDTAAEKAQKNFAQMTEDAQNAADALNEAENSYKNLQNTIESYEETRSNIDSLTQGTEEFKAAVIEANKAARDLIETYGVASTYDASTGLINITPDDLDKALEKQQEELEQARVNNVAAQSNKFMASSNLSNAQIVEKNDSGYWDYVKETIGTTVASGMAIGAATGAAGGLFAPITSSVGTLVGAISGLIGTFGGAAVSIAKQNDTNEKEISALEALQEAYIQSGGNFEMAMDSLGEDQKGLIDSLGSTDSELEALCSEVSANTAAILQNNKELVDSNLADNANYQNSKYKDQLNTMLADTLTDETDRLYDTYYSNDAGKLTDKEAQQQYADLMGYTWVKNKTGNIGVYSKGDGSADFTISDETARRALAQKEAMDALDGSIEAYSKTLETVSQTGESFGAGLGDLMLRMAGGQGASFSDVSGSQLKVLQSQLDNTENATDIISDEDAQNMGYADAQTYVDALQTGINSYYDAIEKVKDNLTTSVEAVFNDLNTEDLSVDAAQNLGDTLTKAFINAGSDGLAAVKEVYSEITEGPEEFADALVGIDWQTATVSDIAETLNEAGVAGSWTAEQLQALIDALYETGEASLESATQNYAAIHKITDGLSQGDTISAEDYATLGEEYSKYFMLMADGTYKLTHDAEEFQKIVKENTLKPFQNVRTESKENQSRLENIRQNGLQESGFTGTVSKQNLQNEFDALKAFGGADAADLAEWQERLKNVGVSAGGDWVNDMADAYNKWIESVGGTEAALDSLDSKIKDCQNTTLGAEIAIASTYTTVDDLTEAFNNGEFEAQAFNTALMQLNAASDLEGLDSDELKEYADYLQEAAKSADDVADGMADFNKNMSDKEAEIVAKGIMKMNDAIDDLADNFDDWQDILKKSSKSSEEYSQALSSTQKAVGKLLDVSEDYVSEDFVTEHLDDIKKAATGDADAIDGLRAALAQDIIANIILENGIDESAITAINDDIASLQEWLNNNDLKIGASIDMNQLSGDKENFLATCQDIIDKAGMTADQANAFFDSMGFETAFVTESQPVEKTGYGTVTVTEPYGGQEVQMPDGSTFTIPSGYQTKTYAGDPYQYIDYVDTIAMNTDSDGNPTTPKIESVTRKATGASNNYSKTNSGGKSSGSGSSSGGSKGNSKKPDKSNIVERYKEITDAINDNTRAMDKASKAADRLYGKNRIDYLKKQNALLKEQKGLLEQKKAEAEKKYLPEDEEALRQAAADAGVNLNIDPITKNITNYTSEMQKLEDQMNALIDQFYEDENISDDEQDQIDKLQEKIDALTKAIDQYEETRDLIHDLEEQIQDAYYEWQDNNYEILHYELEIKIEINDLELEKIDYYINKLSDDFYSMAEVVGYMNQKFSEAQDALGYYEGFYNDLNAAFANGEISQEKYVEGLKESYSAILDQLTSLNDLDKEMMHYYEDTLDAAADELSYYTDQLEHLNSVLDHYKNLVTLVNGELDYKSIGKILDGQAKVLKNQLDVASANYKMLLSEKAEIEQSLANAQDEAARELFEEELKAITTKVNEAQEEMLSKTEEWAEAQKAIMENAMAEAAKAMEEEFTDGLGFDALSNSIDRLNSYADEYLTKTNQIYETQKLINTAQQAADKTTNEAAKARLNSYMKEVETLQEKNQLSNLELEIAKAKYDVVLAEIALEEAQNAKSTVRLQRDNEGNFGYVYTANQDDVSKAEQDLADAQNKLYNIGLEGTNEYGQKLLELQQKLADDLIALEEARAAGQYATDEEYYAARDQLISEYNDLFRAYSEQYTTAMGVDANIQQEAWINAYESMINKTGEWQDKTSTYIEKCEESYSSWRQVVEDESEIIDGILNDLESEVDDVTESSDELYEEVKNKIIPGLKDELVAVRNVTSAYAAQRQQIQELISYYEQLTQSILSAIQAQAGLSGGDSSSGVDWSQDFSKLMTEAWEQGDMEAYAQYKQLREEKIAAGYSDWGVSTDWVDNYLKNGGELPDGMSWVDLYKQLNGGFATGGFTGTWGPEGKLTFLHEKELVLNKDDTANFLTATNMLRDISDMIDLKALQDKVSILPYLPGVSTNGSSDTLEQIVTIEAHFPSVTSHSEIEEAFNTLVNRASQYANRK